MQTFKWLERTLDFALKIPYLAIFWLEIEKAIVMLDFSTFNLLKGKVSCKKKDFLKYKTKIVLFGYFLAGTRKSYCAVAFSHQQPQFFYKKNFVQK